MDSLGLLFSLSNKTVVLTGASSGLGARFAHVMAGYGANVVAAARRSDRLEKLAQDIEAAGFGQIHVVPCDITEADAPQRLISSALDTFGAVDVVVNNAGISRVLPAIDDSLDDFRSEMEVNLIAPYELARLAASWMINANRPGSIINIGSILGAGGGGRLKAPGYAASKGGLHNLTRELASQWARKNVRVNTIAPGWFGTEMNSEMFETDGGMSYIVDNTPMGRPGEEDELDGALVFLASDASSYVTGHTLFVDGGWTAV